ncbi:MAG TPA: LLM class flavin-dependent oxidoreductase [Acidimicrobiales bacterium]|nr:LLM class flavin-dependent oxidoreductase [Acidimicrobiales bacterium]
MKVGITLPQFRHEAEPALEVARRAEAAGLDGVFVFDHLWPLGQPGRPALQSLVLLGALVVETARVTLGPLVARVGLVPDALLVNQLITLHRMAGDRLVAALGTGDSGNQGENEAYGLPFGSVAERLGRLEACCRALRAAGVRTWVGGRSAAVRAAAGQADGWNGWGTDVAGFVADVAVVPEGRELTWGGQILVGRTPAAAQAKLRAHGGRPGLVSGTVDDLVAHFRGLAAAGASWAICAPLDVGTDPGAVEMVAEAAAACR